MSLSLYWQPVPEPQPEDVPGDLDWLLRQRYWDAQGYPRTDPVDLDSRDIAWLEGLRDAGKDGAEELIAIIRKHGTIRLTWRG